MIKLIFSKVEDISKTATFPEKNFITVIYQGFCLGRCEISGRMRLASTVFENLKKKTQQNFV